MEQLEPRLLLAGDFFAADEWAIIKEGSTATTAEELPNSGSLDDGIYYLGVAPEDGPLDPAEAPIKVIATGSGYIGRAGGTEPLHFMDVKTYIKNKMEWELLFCGHFDLEEDETFTSELTVLNCSGGLDTLEIAGLAFEPSGIGFNQPGGEGQTQSALLQGDLSVDVGAAILGGLQAFDGVRFGGVDQDYWDGITQLQFSVDENNYIKSNKDYGIFVSGMLENVIEQDKQVKIKTPWGPRIEIEDLAVSIDTTEMALKVQGEVEVEELPFLNEIRADLTGDNYISLDFAPGTPIEDRINIIGELTFDSTPAKGFDVVYGLNVNTIDGEWGASVDIDTKKIGQFKGEATFDGLELTDFRVEADPKRNIPVVAPYLYLDSGYIDVSDWNQTSTTYEVGTTFNIGPGLQIKLPEWAQSMFGVKKLKGALGQLDLSGTWQPSTNSFGATTDVKVLPVDIDDAEYSLVKQSGTFGGTWPHSLHISGAAQIPAKEVEGVPEDIAIISGSMAARIQGSRSGYNL
ncbi:MAG: LEPR-XLL domain-containing protein, partial [Pirellulaceae bacterium]